ncbi:hypothetical protein NNX39_05180 [Arthrobacter sp. zg-Y826]|uniref:hypothetical protein n=1 Tax=Arthrobacter jinronghuae TaxID=2964609 RepID=UPI0021054F0F|nr:hypothetical protein [Arthrobacter jinronghuae]MCQ1955899.1 hypothetical protein [Arthrobacter jinronghuae]
MGISAGPRPAFTAAGLALLVAVLAGCGTDPADTATSRSTASSSPSPSPAVKSTEKASTKAKPSPATATKSPAPASSASQRGLGVKGNLETAHGTYLQVSPAEDDPAWTLDPALVEPKLLSLYSQAQIEEAHRNNLAFMVEEGLDSPLNGGAWTPDQWWAANGQRIAPELQGMARQSLSDGSPFGGVVMQSTFHQERYGDSYRYVYEQDRSRFTKLDIEVLEVWLADDNKSIVTEISATAEMEVAPGAGEPGTNTQVIEASMTLCSRPGETAGEWLITDWRNLFQVTAG